MRIAPALSTLGPYRTSLAGLGSLGTVGPGQPQSMQASLDAYWLTKNRVSVSRTASGGAYPAQPDIAYWCALRAASYPPVGNTPFTAGTPEEYLRAAVWNADWDRVFNYYAYTMANIFAASGTDKHAYWAIAQLDLAQYANDGHGTYRSFTRGDVRGFASKVVAKLAITDLGNGHCSFGVLNPGAANVDPMNLPVYGWASNNVPGQWAGGLGPPALDSSGVSGWIQFLFNIDALSNGLQNQLFSQRQEPAPLTGPAPFPGMSIGWMPAPNKDWYGIIISTLVIAGFAYVAAAGALAAFSASATSTASGASAASSTSSAAGGAVAAPVASAPTSVVSIASSDEILVLGSGVPAATATTLSTPGAIAALTAGSGSLALTTAGGQPTQSIQQNSSGEDELTVTAPHVAPDVPVIQPELTPINVAATLPALVASAANLPVQTGESNQSPLSAAGTVVKDLLGAGSTLSKILGGNKQPTLTAGASDVQSASALPAAALLILFACVALLGSRGKKRIRRKRK